ncbi:hypothetical protein C1X05_00175 [Laceyella sacchari]|uniref:Holin n=1 Tax=Laceyella tengchongensis TaxID=574699 RepID=A0AA45WQE6_9BACL|nr:hypothetical protein [Laceyella tengchongensis]AUS07428.1 hypothetical protein C1X05_00175 [Laceyella sacchari]SMP24884.1 hypothetical protein SAMN06265361_1057 [Laceyella tengchongensis]
MQNIMLRLRDPKVWGLLFAFVKLLLGALGLNIAPEQWAVYETVFNSFCGLAVALGIFVYNPKAIN